MSVWAEELTRALQGEVKLLEELAQTAEDQKNAIQINDIAVVDRISNRQQVLTLQLQLAETERTKLLQRYGLDEKNLRQLAAQEDGAAGKSLAEALHRMTAAAGTLKRYNELNSRLLQTRLDYIGKIRGFIDRRDLYSGDGKADPIDEKTTLIDKRI